MVMFDHNIMPPRQQMKDSLLCMLMTDARAKTAALLRFRYDKNDVLEIENHDDDNGKNNNNLFVDIFFLL
jgi:hypothetical protein